MRGLFNDIFQSLGYDITLPGAEMYYDVLCDVIEDKKNGMSNSKILEMIPRYCLEYYHFCYEVGRIKFFQLIDEFRNSKKPIRKKKRKVNVDDLFDNTNLSFEKHLLSFAPYFITKEQELDKNKQYVKK